MQTPTPLEHTTVWGLVSEASLVVQAVMLCLGPGLAAQLVPDHPAWQPSAP